jgi:hypothetical protein
VGIRIAGVVRAGAVKENSFSMAGGGTNAVSAADMSLP